MSRLIKFRGQRVDNNEWVFGNLINWHPKLNPRIVWFNEAAKTSQELDFFETIFEVKPETVGQFIGTHDKNGKEVYDGDIVLYEGQFLAKVYWNKFAGQWWIDFLNQELSEKTISLSPNYSEMDKLVNYRIEVVPNPLESFKPLKFETNG